MQNCTSICRICDVVNWCILYYDDFLRIWCAFVGNEAIIKANPAGNMAPLLAKALGGDFLFAFVSAIAFATILAVVAGLVLTARSAFAHDFYNEIIRKGKSTEKSKYPWLVMHLLE